MILPDGSEIPNCPADPEARRLWKTIYFSKLYGSNAASLRNYCEVDAAVTAVMMRDIQRIWGTTPPAPTLWGLFLGWLGLRHQGCGGRFVFDGAIVFVTTTIHEHCDRCGECFSTLQDPL